MVAGRILRAESVLPRSEKRGHPGETRCFGFVVGTHVAPALDGLVREKCASSIRTECDIDDSAGISEAAWDCEVVFRQISPADETERIDRACMLAPQNYASCTGKICGFWLAIVGVSPACDVSRIDGASFVASDTHGGRLREGDWNIFERRVQRTVHRW